MSIARLVSRRQVDSHKVLMVKNGTLGEPRGTPLRPLEAELVPLLGQPLAPQPVRRLFRLLEPKGAIQMNGGIQVTESPQKYPLIATGPGELDGLL